MSVRRTSFGKVERERAKKAKAAAKRELRQSRGTADDDSPDVARSSEPGQSTTELLRQVEELHQRFDAGVMPYEDFETQKADLMGRIRLD